MLQFVYVLYPAQLIVDEEGGEGVALGVVLDVDAVVFVGVDVPLEISFVDAALDERPTVEGEDFTGEGGWGNILAPYTPCDLFALRVDRN